MTVDLSIIICTYNPNPILLERVLLPVVTQAKSLDRAEILLVDNNSSVDVISSLNNEILGNINVIREDRQGHVYARIKGINSCSGNIILFLDDDNVIEDNYIRVGIEKSLSFPFLGTWGAGILAPEYQQEPDSLLAEYTGALALRIVKYDEWSNIMLNGSTPWGAGLFVRRHVALEYARFVESLPDDVYFGRRGTELLGGDDDLFSFISIKMGMGKGVFKDLQLTHVINASRVKKDYLLELIEGSAYTACQLRDYFGLPIKRNFAFHKPMIIFLTKLLTIRKERGMRAFLNHITTLPVVIKKNQLENEFVRAKIRATKRYISRMNERKTFNQ